MDMDLIRLQNRALFLLIAERGMRRVMPLLVAHEIELLLARVQAIADTALEAMRLTAGTELVLLVIAVSFVHRRITIRHCSVRGSTIRHFKLPI